MASPATVSIILPRWASNLRVYWRSAVFSSSSEFRAASFSAKRPARALMPSPFRAVSSSNEVMEFKVTDVVRRQRDMTCARKRKMGV